MKEALRVVQVGLDFVPQNGGTATAIRDFRDALDGEVVSFTRPDLVPVSRAPGVVHVPTHPSLLGTSYSWSRSKLRQQAEQVLRGADLIVVHSLFRYHVQWARTAARASRIPFWVVPHGALDPYVFTYRAWQKRPWMKLVGQPVLRAAASVIFATSREREKAAPYARGCAQDIVPWPVRVSDEVGEARTRTASRTRLGIPTDAKVLLLLGRLHPAKRILEAIDALAACDDPRIHLLVVGPGSAELPEATCVRYAAGLPCSGRVHVTGPAFGPEKEALFHAADALVNLSYKENFGYTAAEALAMGLPVILSPGNDLAPELERIRCGWFLRSLDRGEAAQSLRSFAEADAATLREMGTRGQEWVRQELAPRRFAERLHALAARTTRPAT